MAFDAFMKVDGIDGESTDDKHKDWIELISFSHGLVQPVSGSRSTSGAASSERCDHQDFSIVKKLDKASPELYLHCCHGRHIPKITVELCRATADKTKYMAFDLEDVIVTSVMPSGTGGGDLPMENVTFNYGKITWSYTTTDHRTGKTGGEIVKFWDLTLNKGG